MTKPAWNEMLALLQAKCPQDLSVFSRSFLERSLDKRKTALGMVSFADYCTLFNADENECTAFTHSLNIQYSEFFRNPLSFALLEQNILPRIIAEKQDKKHCEIRVWSAGCAAGQEAYSVAILLEELQKRSNDPFHYRIFATDLQENVLIQARRGLYPASALKNMRLNLLNTWFQRQEDDYSIAPSLKEKIDFSRFDLLAEAQQSPPNSIYGDFDLILCCNVLIYYEPQHQKQMLIKLNQNLGNNGILVTDESERSVALMNDFHELFHSAPIFRAGRGKRKAA